MADEALACGILAGPVFIGTWLVQALTRDGYRIGQHPMSLLALGGAGWVRIANFVVTGALCVATAHGLRRVLRGGPGSTWAPRAVLGAGVGTIIAGVFVTDAGAGFPPGAPAGAPVLSWHGVAHEIGFVVAVVSWTLAALVLARRYAVLGLRGRVGMRAAAVLGSAVQLGLLAVVCAQERRALLTFDRSRSKLDG